MLNLPMDHIGLHCSDVELNAKWYQEELGFKVAGKFPGMGGRNVYFLENPQDGKMYEISQRDQLPGGATTRIDHIAYRSSDAVSVSLSSSGHALLRTIALQTQHYKALRQSELLSHSIKT